MNDTTLSEQIRKLRLSKKFTLAVMAERLGVTTSAVAAYENGSRNPSFDVLVKIARIFNVTVDNLLGGDDKDLINVSGLISEQRENVESLISTYKKLNTLIGEVFRVSIEQKDIMESILSSSYDVFLDNIKYKEINRKRAERDKEDKIVKEVLAEKEAEIEEAEDNKTKDLEERIKILEEMIKQGNKNNDT